MSNHSGKIHSLLVGAAAPRPYSVARGPQGRMAKVASGFGDEPRLVGYFLGRNRVCEAKVWFVAF